MKHLTAFFLIIILVVTVFVGCELFSSSSGSSPSDYTGFENAFMQSFDILHSNGIIAGEERSVAPQRQSSYPASRATVTVGYGDLDYSFTDQNIVLADYPEEGQSTTYSVWDQSSNIYKITATTSYPEAAIQSHTIETYYIRDKSPGNDTPDGIWTNDDPIVKPDGTVDPRHRDTFETWFRDGSVRYETIVAVRSFDGMHNSLSAFDFVSGAMSYPAIFIPATDGDAIWSSVVVYTHIRNTDHNYSFWSGSQEQNILGIRYYTETLVSPGIDPNVEETVIKSTLAFEKAVSAYLTHGGDYIRQLSDIYLGSEHQTLAESVIRQIESYTGTDTDGDGDFDSTTAPTGKQTKMQSHVVDITGGSDMILLRMNDEATELLDWEGSSLYLPAGDAEEIATTVSDSQIERSTTLSDSEGLEISIVETDIGSSDIALLYRSISNGAAYIPSTSVPRRMDADGDGTVENYTGNEGRTVQSALGETSIHLSTRGTLEVWLYTVRYQNFGGIIHKGTAPDFSDESYSLQFWGDRGEIAFVVNQSPAQGYRITHSTYRLNRNSWYHLVATWDSETPVGGKYYMNLYINGTLNARTEIPAGYTAHQNASPLVIGSQLAGEENVLSGYYGFEGYIDGVRLYDDALAADAVRERYLATRP